jgi:hypothetical protein
MLASIAEAGGMPRERNRHVGLLTAQLRRLLARILPTASSEVIVGSRKSGISSIYSLAHRISVAGGPFRDRCLLLVLQSSLSGRRDPLVLETYHPDTAYVCEELVRSYLLLVPDRSIAEAATAIDAELQTLG